jgi:hypothetical protein
VKTIQSQIFLTIILLLATKQNAFAQGSFVNLNFEQATLVIAPGGFGLVTSDAIPGWTAYTYGTPQTVIVYDDISLGAAAVSIHDTNGFEPILQGRFSMLLQGQFSSTSNTNDIAAIAQTGHIPATAQSLTFFGVLGNFQTTFNGQVIALTAVGSGANYTVYGGDISLFAGQTGELRFTALSPGEGLIDNIQFSPQAIPESNSLALFGVGALLLGFFRRRNPRDEICFRHSRKHSAPSWTATWIFTKHIC